MLGCEVCEAMKLAKVEKLRIHATLFKNMESHQFCPLGSGAVAGNALGIDRDFLAQELGFRQGPKTSLNETVCR